MEDRYYIDELKDLKNGTDLIVEEFDHYMRGGGRSKKEVTQGIEFIEKALKNIKGCLKDIPENKKKLSG